MLRLGVVLFLLTATVRAEPAPFTVFAADVGGMAGLRVDDGASINTRPAFELGAAAGWGWIQHRPWGWDERAILLRARGDYTSGAQGVRGLAADVTFQTWERIRKTRLDLMVDLLFEFGVGFCGWDRSNVDAVAPTRVYGLDVMASIGLPLDSDRDFLLAFRVNTMSATHGSNYWWFLLGDQHFATYGLVLTWQPSHLR